MCQIGESVDSHQHLDSDILFNPPPWHSLIETQRDLFDIDELRRISDRTRLKFYLGNECYPDMPIIAQAHWNTPLLTQYAGKEIGYDLPCLISANRPSIGRLMFCAQDPLRKDLAVSEPKISVGTFFGLDSSSHRRKRHWKAIWNFIRDCVHAGYDVWVTDAIKIFAGVNVVMRDNQLRELCFSTIRKEVEAVQPDKILAIGNVARSVLTQSGINYPISHVSHPTAHGIRGSFKDRMKGYSQALFDAETPQ